MDRSFYTNQNKFAFGIQQDAANLANSMCNFIAIFQNAYFNEHQQYATYEMELAVFYAVMKEEHWGNAGLPEDRSEAFVASHQKALDWMRVKGFLQKRHSIVIVNREHVNSGTHYVCQLINPSDHTAQHFINVVINDSEVVVTHDGYRDSWLAKHGDYGTFRSYPVL